MAESRIKRHAFFLSILAATSAGLLFVLKDFLSVIVIAGLYAILVRPVYAWFHKQLRGKPHLAAIATIIFSFFIVLVPLFLLINLFVQEASQLTSTFVFDLDHSLKNPTIIANLFNTTFGQLPFVPHLSPLDVRESIVEVTKPVSSFLIGRAVEIGKSSFHILTNLIIFLVLTYFIIPELSRIKAFLKKLSPLDNSIDELYMNRVVSMFIATAKGTFFVAVLQGILAGIFFWLAGIQFALILGGLAAFASILPIVGMSALTIPISAFLLITGDYMAALIIIVGQIVVISSVDEFIRALYTSKQTSMHPAIMLLSIIGGLKVFGVLGFIYGPIVVILFLTSLEIYMKHYKY